MSRAWHGLDRAFLADGAEATSLRALGRNERTLDPSGVRAAWGEHDDDEACILMGVRRPARVRLVHDPLASEAWIERFEHEVARLARSVACPVLALGGGLDAASVLAAWHASGIAMPTIVTLRTDLPSYDEHDIACATCRVLGARCEVVRVRGNALVERAPDACVAAETPFYDLHPVHRLLLADACGAGTTLITGDGADAAFAHRADLDYVPHVVSLARAVGVEVASPFFDEALTRGAPADREKSLLRRYVRARGLDSLADAPKRPRIVPALDARAIFDPVRVASLAARTGLRVDVSRPGAHVKWATLDHLVRALEAA